MFGHDNQNNSDDQKQTTQNDSGVTPSVGPVPDDLLNNDDSASSPAPDFDTSNISLPVSEDTAPVSTDSNDSASSPIVDQSTPALSGDSDNLISIKQEALQQLSPLVDHLEQSPEEKFRTTMMMIQASDDQSLVKAAYEAAKQITDEKVRAQALLDIVNEINYFTQQKNQ